LTARVLTIRECHDQLEEATLPDGLLLARNAALPDLEVKHALGVLLGPGVKAERVVLPPLLPVRNGWSAKFGLAG
jgi:hypothetical protein